MTGETGALFTDRERRCFAPPERLTPSQWAARYAVIPRDKPHAGRYSPDLTPYIAGIIDALIDPYIELIAVRKSAQAGYTTGLIYAIGWAIEQQGQNVLLVMPDQVKAAELLREEFLPAVEATPRLRDRLVDSVERRVDFESASLFTASARSPADLARRSLPYVVIDEVDKFPARSANSDGDPVSLAIARARAWGSRGKCIIGSTPTVRTGYIIQIHEQCEDHRQWHVPCPHCHEFQPWIFQQLRCEKQPNENKSIEAASIKTVWYECLHCKQRIEENQRREMNSAGKWVSIERHSEQPRSVGFHINVLANPMVGWRKILRQAIRCSGDQQKYQEFVNQWLGDPFESVVKTIESKLSPEQRAALPRYGIVPIWANVLIGSVDVQKRGDAFEFVWLLRAWGSGGRSQLVAWGRAPTEQVLLAAVRASYPIEQTALAMPVSTVWIDSGFESTSVYGIAAKYGWQPLKGASKLDAPIYRDNTRTPIPGQRLCVINTHLYKERIANAQKSGKWLLNAGSTREQLDEYLSHLSAERMIEDSRRHKRYWVEIKAGAPNHYLDCECYNAAAAHIMAVELLPEPHRTPGQQPAAPSQQSSQRRSSMNITGLYEMQ